MKIVASSDAEKLVYLIWGKRSATVEARYGSRVIEGSVITLARPEMHEHEHCACMNPNRWRDLEVIGTLPDITLNILGGILSLVGVKPEDEDFWKLVAWTEARGAHMMEKGEVDELQKNSLRIHSWNAWRSSPEGMLFTPPEDPYSVGPWVVKAVQALHKILEDDPQLLQKGIDFLQKEKRPLPSE